MDIYHKWVHLLLVRRNVVKSFYTAGLIYDILLVFGELSDEAQKNGKYAKWKAAYIHNCLKNGETPVPGKHTNIIMLSRIKRSYLISVVHRSAARR